MYFVCFCWCFFSLYFKKLTDTKGIEISMSFNTVQRRVRLINSYVSIICYMLDFSSILSIFVIVIKTGDGVEHGIVGSVAKPSGSTICGCPRCDVQSYDTYDINRNPYDHLHSSIDYIKYIEQNPNVKLDKMRKEKGYNSFGYLKNTAFVGMTNISHHIGIEPNHQTSNTLGYLLPLLFADYFHGVCISFIFAFLYHSVPISPDHFD